MSMLPTGKWMAHINQSGRALSLRYVITCIGVTHISYDVLLYLCFHWQVKKPFLETKNNLSFLNSLWSSAAYYLGQGPDGNHPVSASGRVSVAVWWFCITILGATYTANLAAYLTTNRLQTPIQSVRDLSQQTSTEYGVVKESQTQRFFATSVIPR